MLVFSALQHPRSNIGGAAAALFLKAAAAAATLWVHSQTGIALGDII